MNCLVKYQMYDAQGQVCGTGSRVIERARSTSNAAARMLGRYISRLRLRSRHVALRSYNITEEIPVHARAAVAALVPVQGSTKKRKGRGIEGL